jgi:hypothetical protein
MANLITVKIDVRKLDKTRFFEGKPDKNGHRPLYADIVLMPKSEVGQYGDTHFVIQSKKKDENVQMSILGSATERVRNGGSAPRSEDRPAPNRQENLDEDVLF